MVIKMISHKFWFFLFFVSFVKLSANKFDCRLTFSFAKVCIYYETNCIPNFEKCKRTRTTVNDFKCPKFVCVSYIVFQDKLLLNLINELYICLEMLKYSCTSITISERQFRGKLFDYWGFRYRKFSYRIVKFLTR